jgi:hypothetical protein
MKILNITKKFIISSSLNFLQLENFQKQITSLPEPFFFDENTLFVYLKIFFHTDLDLLSKYKQFLSDNNAWSEISG